ncbi:MAG: PAS domain-containing protein [Thiovulaceae bacterium]|nr:PAS domain-containing protein [Sulfurimonadaceae bacterium]
MLKEMGAEDFIVSKTDKKGKITYVNRIFMDMAEYAEAELLGKPHSIIRHSKMPKVVFKLLWERIEKKEEIFAFVINKTKNNNAYWVYANITASLDENGDIVGYYSVRRKPNPKALETIEPIYEKMLEAEKTGGMEASGKILEDLLFEQGVSYDELIISLQG